MTDLAAIMDELRRSPVPLAKWLPSGKAAPLTDEDYDWIARKLAALLADTPSVEPREEGTVDADGTYHPTAEDYAMGNTAAGHEHWDDR